jgi:hypothetical protein
MQTLILEIPLSRDTGIFLFMELLSKPLACEGGGVNFNEIKTGNEINCRVHQRCRNANTILRNPSEPKRIV